MVVVMMEYVIFFVVSILASIVGTICGVGGGVFMKPALDAVGIFPVNMITFLSTCTVTSMSLYNVITTAIDSKKNKKEDLIDWKLTTWLALGGAVGGIIGKTVYTVIKDSFTNQDTVGGYQAIALLVAVFLTYLYSSQRHKIQSLKMTNPTLLVILGLCLGTVSSFVGIGGGPMNMAVLYYFFSMPTKMASQNSIYMILFSQSASLITTFIQGSVPSGFYESSNLGLWVMLIGMIVCGIVGGYIGKKINKKISNETVDKLFLFLLIVIMLLCGYNAYKKLA